MATPNQQNLVEKNKQYAASFDKGHLPLPPGKKYAVLTCMDARIDPAAAYGIDLGDAHIIRNAGASAKDALRSLIISEQLLGTQEILLIKHTGCGMLTFENEQARAIVEKKLGKEAGEQVKGLDFLPFPDLEEEVRKDVEWLREQKTIPEHVTVSGWVYEVETGKVRRVE
ncbi:Carbonic anhydrase [Macrophomina phaseolina MS6]|uniref:Carbonic anhydrase n=1 Tax=Macrophomina phaseolina (strain MS6) TaxID=1126212 RepID=K2R7G1_MACPH|nr:Carbonic anhydrase [Macrophomina phaseolina MS6]